jgi:3',5'-cyclic AMP phosphodiesterase CpdA
LLVTPSLGETARGFVFHDSDADGVRDPDEPGLPGVVVSDGRRVAVTDADGAWQIDFQGDAVFFVTKPSDWMTPVDEWMIPRFHYVHQPEGSPPGLRYPGVEPTGPLPESIDFALRKREEPRRFEAILFADTQPQTQAEVDWMRDDVIAELIGTRAAFGMTLGDILFDDLSLFPRHLSVIARLRIPWYNVPGNHDMNLLAADDRHSLETFKRYFGPPYYSFDYGDAHFVVLDNIEYGGSGESDPADYRGNGGYLARIGRRQLAWLESDLEHVPQDKLVFLAMHSPLQTDLGDNPRTNTQDRRDLFRILAGREHLYAVAGHTHTTEHHYFDSEDGFPGPGVLHHHVLTTVSGSWWSGPIDDRGIPVAEQRDGTPNGYHVLEVDGTDLSVRYKAAGKPEDYQMRVLFDAAHHHHRPEALRDFRPGDLLDGRLSVDELPAAQVVVNLFDGGPNSIVEMMLEGRQPVQMRRRRQIDPFVNELFLRHQDVKKPWVEAVPSSHVWVGDLPDDLAPGFYTLTVKASDEFGRLHHAHRVLEIQGSSAPPPDRLHYPE